LKEIPKGKAAVCFSFDQPFGMKFLKSSKDLALYFHESSWQHVRFDKAKLFIPHRDSVFVGFNAERPALVFIAVWIRAADYREIGFDNLCQGFRVKS
jgi:hypothetical protein